MQAGAAGASFQTSTRAPQILDDITYTFGHLAAGLPAFCFVPLFFHGGGHSLFQTLAQILSNIWALAMRETVLLLCFERFLKGRTQFVPHTPPSDSISTSWWFPATCLWFCVVLSWFSGGFPP